jgi:hypothetical protein
VPEERLEPERERERDSLRQEARVGAPRAGRLEVEALVRAGVSRVGAELVPERVRRAVANQEKVRLALEYPGAKCLVWELRESEWVPAGD